MASVLQVATIKDQGGNANAIEIANSSANVTINNLAAGTISDAVTQPNKYYIQGTLNANHTAAGGVNLYVAGTTSPYFVWNDTLSNSGFDVGSSSNYDFKFTKKGIYQINFSASFHHITSNTSRFIHCAIRGNGSTSVSTNVLASASDQIAQTLTGSTDYGNCSCSFVGLFDVNDLINFWTDADTPASDAVRRSEMHVSVFLIRAVA